MAVKKKYYVVWVGRHTGVFDSWDDAEEQVKGFPEAKYKSFPTQEAAVAAYRGNPSEHLDVIKAIAGHKSTVVNYEAFPEIQLDALAVDAACSRNPGPVEYQGVTVGTGERLFRVGPLAGGSNNLGEFLAIVHGLALLDRMGQPYRPIYSDSRTAIAWVRNRKARTTIAPGPHNARILDMVRRAEAWLATHTYRNPILKWNTEEWGEIPADFGRK
nr:ribonuclease H [Bacteroides sp.]